MTTIFVAWQDPETRSWHPVGQLSEQNAEFTFCYTKGAQASPRFRLFGRLNDLDRTYRSKELFPIFANRLLDEARPEYPDYLRWLQLDRFEPLAMLDLTGGHRQTDGLAMFARPEIDSDGNYRGHFFCHGIRHLPKEAQTRVAELRQGDPLYPLLDVQNPVDPNAVALRTDDPPTMIGYCPRYRAQDFRHLISEDSDSSARFWVERVNSDAPFQLRLLCGIEARWPPKFESCSDEEFEPLCSDARIQNQHQNWAVV